MKRMITYMLLLVVIVGLFPKTVMAQSNFDIKLTQYLNEVSNTRGLTVTKEDLAFSLSTYDLSIDDFSSVPALKEYLGAVIKSNYSNLNTLYKRYNLNKKNLERLLASNGESIKDYIFLSELSDSISFYTGGTPTPTQKESANTKYSQYANNDSQLSSQSVSFNGALPNYLVGIGCTTSEINKLQLHLSSLNGFTNNQNAQNKCLKLTEALTSLCELSNSNNYSVAQKKKAISNCENLINDLQLKAEFCLVDGSVKTPLTLTDLVKDKEYGDGYIDVKLCNNNKVTLSDFSLPTNTYKSVLSNRNAYTTPSPKKVSKKVNTVKPVVKSNTTHKTIKGGKLPVTATNTAALALTGFVLILGGALVIWKIKNLQNAK